MQTIKTGVVVALLIAVCYGAFIALNAPDPQLPQELQEWAAAEGADLEGLLEIEVPGSGLSSASAQAAVDALTGNAPAFALPGNEQAGSPNPALNLPSFDVAADGSGDPAPDFPSISGPALLNTPLDSGPSEVAGGALLPPIANPVDSPVQGEATLAGGPGVGEAGHPGLPVGPSGVPATRALISESPQATNRSASVKREIPNVADNALTPTFPGGPVDFPPTNSLVGDSPPGSEAESENSNAPTIPKFSLARDEWLNRAKVHGELKEALKELSRYYNSPELTHSQHSDLVDILDGLAREVIYSKRHLIMRSHVSAASETVESIAKQYSITPELLAKINGLGDAKALVAGTELKVIPGPFSAEVSLSRNELTLFAQGMYAGRFGVSLGNDPFPKPGRFEVGARQRDRAYFGIGSAVIAANDPTNPYGGFWLNLGRDVCIHGSPERISPALEEAGCISLAPLDASDVYDILTVGSQVSIID